MLIFCKQLILAEKKIKPFAAYQNEYQIFTCFRGAEFRKDFSRIGENLLSRFPDIPVMVFTATAPPKAQQQIIKNLNLRNYFH
jgi:hypothetical protein